MQITQEQRQLATRAVRKYHKGEELSAEESSAAIQVLMQMRLMLQACGKEYYLASHRLFEIRMELVKKVFDRIREKENV